ncbi:MAG: hypothetical protein IJT30_00100 [Muribaculaceae bacterium]|nr:hypothetical protein [Muribaculaceae bacterium]
MNNKNLNGKTSARRERDREFLACYTQALQLAIAQRVPNAQQLAVCWTIHNGSPHYHVSYERAYKVVRRLLADGTEPPIRESLQLEMWREIARRVAALTAGTRVSVAKALEFVLEYGRASRFFVTERYARETLVPRARRERMDDLRRQHHARLTYMA